MTPDFGPHMTVDLEGCAPAYLSDLRTIWQFLNTFPLIIGMTKITQPYVFPYSGLVPEDSGITGTVIIAESHISIHTFEQKGYAFIDVFSCRKFNTAKAEQVIVEYFKPSSYDISIINRGKRFPR